MILVLLVAFIVTLRYLMIARALLSWFVRDFHNPLMQMLHQVTEPFLIPIRALLQQVGLQNTMFDISFIVGYILLIIVENMLRGLL